MALRAGGGNRALRIICHRNQHQRQPDRGPHDVVTIESGSYLEVGHRSPPFRSTNITSAGTNGGRGGPMRWRGRPWLGQARRVHGRDESPAMTAVTFDNGERPRSQEADPTRSASRHPGGTANGSPQTQRESEPASSAVAANARVRRRPGCVMDGRFSAGPPASAGPCP